MRIIFLTIILFLTACSAPPPTVTAPPTPIPFELVLPEGTIRALEHPPTVPAAEATAHIGPFEEVMGVVIGEEARAYPLGLMSRHEIANDTLGGQPIAVTFCPTCNSGIVVSRRIEHARGPFDLTFSVSGLHLDGALVMKAGDSLWPQSRLIAMTGDLAGTPLELLPANQMSWQEWVATHPDSTLVIDEQPVPIAPRDFSLPGLTSSPAAPSPPGAGYVLGMASSQGAQAFPLAAVAAAGIVNGEMEGLPPFVLVALGEPGVVVAWQRIHEGQTLTFEWDEANLRDRETGSLWDAEQGAAFSGPLAGAQLTAAPARLTHWLGWKDLYPNTTVWACDDC